jgi:hypothetical protein
MRITTKITWDIETWEILEHEYYEHCGSIALCLGGATQDEKTTRNETLAFMQQMQAEQAPIFGLATTAAQDIQNAWSGAMNPYQYGFSTAEDQELQSQILTQGSQATTNAINAAQLREQQATGGATAAPTGGQQALQDQMQVTGQQATAENLLNEKIEGYNRGTQIAATAGQMVEGSTQPFSASTSAANAATSAAGEASNAQQVVDTANANSLTNKLLGGAIGGAEMFAGGLGAGIGGQVGKSMVGGGPSGATGGY